MWNKPLKVYKGVDNAFALTVNDFDQQPTPVDSFTARFKAKYILAAEGDELAIDKEINLKVGSTNSLDLQILKADLADLEEGFYNFSVTLTTATGKEYPLYFEQNGDAVGEMQVLSGPF